MSILFALLSLVWSLADGADLNPHSKSYYASPCGKWTMRRAIVKSALPLLAAALPNYIHLRVGACQPAVACYARLSPNVRHCEWCEYTAGLAVLCASDVQLLDTDATCAILSHLGELCFCFLQLHLCMGFAAAPYRHIHAGTLECSHYCLLCWSGPELGFNACGRCQVLRSCISLVHSSG